MALRKQAQQAKNYGAACWALCCPTSIGFSEHWGVRWGNKSGFNRHVLSDRIWFPTRMVETPSRCIIKARVRQKQVRAACSNFCFVLKMLPLKSRQTDSIKLSREQFSPGCHRITELWEEQIIIYKKCCMCFKPQLWWTCSMFQSGLKNKTVTWSFFLCHGSIFCTVLWFLPVYTTTDSAA